MAHDELSMHGFPSYINIGIGFSHCRYGGSFEVEGTHDIDQGFVCRDPSPTDALCYTHKTP